MQLAAVEKQFSVAMAGSVVGHLVLLLCLIWYIGAQLEPARSNWVLDITLRADNSNDATVVEAPAHQSTARQPLGAARPVKQTSIRENPAPPRKSAVRAMPRAKDRIKASASPGASSAPAADAAAEAVTVPDPAQQAPASATVLATRERETKQLPVAYLPAERAVTHRPLLQAQSKMLARKFRKWTETFHDTDGLVSHTTWRHKGQAYSAEFRRQAAHDDSDMERVTVEVRTQQDGLQLSTKMHMKRLAFSNFAQFVNRWDPSVQVHDDELDGRFHSNSAIVLAYDRQITPTFHGKVTTASEGVRFADSRTHFRRDKIFRGGLETGVRRISLPKKFPPFQGRTEPEDGYVHVFEDDTHITFYPDGSYGSRAVGSDVSEELHWLSDQPAYLIGAPHKKLMVKGVVTGKVLVYSPERIVIEGNLTYPHPPGAGAGEDAFLGLVSDKFVDIAPPDVTGPGDLHIHAAIYAGRRFAVRKFRKRSHATLHLYGSLSAGTISATEPRYSTKIRYDGRLEERRPPGFPVTDRYEIAHWDGVWTVDHAAASN